jgi:hypothetical protein
VLYIIILDVQDELVCVSAAYIAWELLQFEQCYNRVFLLSIISFEKDVVTAHQSAEPNGHIV